MPATLSQTEFDALAALRAFLLAVLPAGIEVVRGQDNRVAEPIGPDFVTLTPTLRGRLSTNVSSYRDADGAGTRSAKVPTQVTVQVDVHGPGAAENAQIVATLLRDDGACRAFRAAGLDAQPLYAGDPRQAPVLPDQAQVETRWTLDAVLQVNPAVTVPQDFAAAARVTVNPPTDAAP